MVEAAFVAIRHDQRLKAIYERIAERRGPMKAQGRHSTAHAGLHPSHADRAGRLPAPGQGPRQTETPEDTGASPDLRSSRPSRHTADDPRTARSGAFRRPRAPARGGSTPPSPSPHPGCRKRRCGSAGPASPAGGKIALFPPGRVGEAAHTRIPAKALRIRNKSGRQMLKTAAIPPQKRTDQMQYQHTTSAGPKARNTWEEGTTGSRTCCS